jgi:hypothetical protein
MNFHLTFDFDYNYQTDLTNYLDSHSLTYQIIESEITITFSSTNQITEFITHFEL